MKVKAFSPVKHKYRVRSRSNPNEFHIVEILNDGQLRCDCVAGFYKQECYHKEKIINWLLNNDDEINTNKSERSPRQTA
mgnify:CR=1 FL=1